MSDEEPPTWTQDIRDITRWFRIDCSVIEDGSETVILRRILGWDGSDLPDWAQPRQEGLLRVTVTQVDGGVRWSEAEGGQDEAAAIRGDALRRLEPRQDSFIDEEPAADQWGLKLPFVTYEVWCPEEDHARARAAWLGLPPGHLENFSKAGIIPRHVQKPDDVGAAGYAGSTIIHIPQVRPYCPDLHQLVLPGGADSWGRLTAVLAVLDGTVELSTVHGTLNLEQGRELDPMERFAYLAIHTPPASFAALDREHDLADAQFIARLPTNSIVGVGADIELLVVPENSPLCRIKWGLIKSVGFTLRAFTGSHTKPAISRHMVRLAKEPWVERVPQFGHTIPANIRHVPPGNPKKIFDLLADAGQALLICDPYASKEYLAKIIKKAALCKLLTTQSMHDAIGQEWCRSNMVEVRIISSDAGGVHDRFVLGSERGYILGTSFNGLGKRHSFVIECDNKMRWVLREVFENLWTDAPAPNGTP